MSMFGGSWTEDMIAELRANGENEAADRIMTERAYETGQSSASVEQKKPFNIELNGIANLSILIKDMKDEHSYNGDLSHAWDKFASVEKQLVLLERYMLAVARAASNGEQPPYWHDILANPDNYPRNGK